MLHTREGGTLRYGRPGRNVLSVHSIQRREDIWLFRLLHIVEKVNEEDLEEQLASGDRDPRILCDNVLGGESTTEKGNETDSSGYSERNGKPVVLHSSSCDPARTVHAIRSPFENLVQTGSGKRLPLLIVRVH